jgi:hypothetical protein
MDEWLEVRVSKKTEKLRKPEKKNNRKNRIVKNRLKFWKNRPVRFWFYKPETKKTEPNQKNRAKLEKTEQKPSQIELKPSQTKKTEPNRF